MGEFLLFVILSAFYFLYFIVGYNKKNATAIFTLNLLLGWTLIGWIVALVWAVSKDKEDVVIFKSNTSKSISDEIVGLKKLYDEGVLTKSEFEEQKRKLLN
mgnify:FL=1